MKSRYAVFFLSLVLAISLAVPALGGPTNPVATLSASVKSTALKALKKAKAAQKTANSALSAANAAQNTANSAEKNAKGAAGTAATALTAAKTAQTAAEAAQATANSKFGTTVTEFGTASGPNTTAGADFVECPAGSQVTGGGYTTSGTGFNEVVPIFTAAYGNAWLADLERIPGQADTWSVTASVTCAKP